MPESESIGQSGLRCISASLVGATMGVYCAGQNSYGQLGNGNTTQQNAPVAFTTPSGQPARNLVYGSGGYNVCAITSFNAMYCAGTNGYGELGNGGTTSQSTPVRFGSAIGSIKMGSVGNSTTCALGYNSIAYCAGSNSYGQIGNGNTSSQSTPAQFNVGYQAVVSVMTDFRNTCALTSTADLYCAGENAYGQLGDGTTTNRSSPVKFNVPGGAKVTQFAVLSNNICALADKQLYCAGRNSYGQFGNGDTINQSTPVRFQLP